jgi:3-hydroxymyristoyl/3-hydroxydecanoyl-(acyl carrier protein) dehydratase
MDMADILRLIPQRPPFVMIDGVYKGHEENFTTLTITDNNVLVDDGRFTAAGIVENIAQTAAVCMNLSRIDQTGGSAIGYIGSVKRLRLNCLPKIGDTIRTTVEFVHRIMNAHVVRGKVYQGEEEIATCDLQIFEQPSVK